MIHGLPASIHLLVQLVGRGGRDGLPWHVEIFATQADLVKNRALLDKEASHWTREYLRFSTDALDMVEQFARAERCLDCLLLASKHARSTPLNVPFARLEEFKRESRGRARWCRARKQWFVPALRSASGLEAWVPGGAEVEEAGEEEACGRCTACRRKAKSEAVAVGSKRKSLA